MAQEKRGEDIFMFNADPPTPPPPPIPPDQRKATFKEKVMGIGLVKRREPRQFKNLVTTGVMAKENVNGDRLFPSLILLWRRSMTGSANPCRVVW